MAKSACADWFLPAQYDRDQWRSSALVLFVGQRAWASVFSLKGSTMKFIHAGDVFDRAVPNTEAVKLLDDTLTQLVLVVQVPVTLIAGNHDSPQRLQFGARLMESLRASVPRVQEYVRSFYLPGIRS
jgi:hypothetical protein